VAQIDRNGWHGLTEISGTNRTEISMQSQNYLQQINKSSKHFEKLLQNFNTKNLTYLLILNLFFFLTSGISIYIAIKKSIDKNKLLEIQKENEELNSKILNVSYFFTENPKSLKNYKKWHKKRRH